MYNEDKLIDNRKNKALNKKTRKLIVLILIMIIASSSIFYAVSRYYIKKNTGGVTTAANNAKLKEALPAMDTKADLRESTLISEVPSNDPSKLNVYASDGKKVAYLTFDDGPSANVTPEVLNILDKYNVKATFFLIGSMASQYPDIVKKEAEDGQSIGNHTYSHNYKYIYSNTKAFIDDVMKCDAVLKSILGNNFNSKLVRFPGGSFGAKLKSFREALQGQGFHYIDWNDLTGDAEGKNIPVSKLLSNLKTYTNGKGHVVILMHDASSKETTVQALPQVIEYLKAQGYSFETLK